MCWFLVILFLTFGCYSEAGHGKKLPSAIVVGTVYCGTCFQQDFSMGSHFISGASVAVECKDVSSKPTFSKQVKTNEDGEFRLQLPFSVSKHVKRIKGCTVKLVSSSEPYCAVASSATSSSLLLKSRKQGLHIFSAGFFSFKPNLCNQKPIIHHNHISNKGLFGSDVETPSSFFPPPIKDPNTPPNTLLPTLPTLPKLPPLPPLPGIPTPFSQLSTKTSKNAKFLDQKLAGPEDFNLPPNPFQPPPIVPNPFQPAPQIPNPFQPPSPTPLIPSPSGPLPFFPFPSAPSFSPSPPPPNPTPSFPFPFPPWAPPPASSSNNVSP